MFQKSKHLAQNLARRLLEALKSCLARPKPSWCNVQVTHLKRPQQKSLSIILCLFISASWRHPRELVERVKEQRKKRLARYACTHTPASRSYPKSVAVPVYSVGVYLQDRVIGTQEVGTSIRASNSDSQQTGEDSKILGEP